MKCRTNRQCPVSVRLHSAVCSLLLLCYPRHVGHGLLDEAFWVGVVLKAAGEIGVVGGEVKVAVAAEVEEDDAGLAGCIAGSRLVDGGADGVR